MKKIILVFVLIISFFIWNNIFAECEYTEWKSLSSFLDDCAPQKVVLTKKNKYDEWNMIIYDNLKIEEWFKDIINSWIKNISLILWILAVWALVYAGLLMQLSIWEEEKIKKAKDIIKWTILWFLALITASWIIYIVINFMFGLWWN